MKQDAPADTLAYHMSRPLVTAKSIAKVPCAHIAQRIKLYYDAGAESSMQVPEKCALWFYMMNHGMADIAKTYDPMEPLPKDVLEFVREYHKVGADLALRAMYYLLLICVRESRHINSKTAIKDAVIAASSYEAYIYLGKVPDSANAAQKVFWETPPKATFGDLVKMLSYQFHNGSYNNGYGGPAWGKIADCLYGFVSGQTSAEIMLDTVWTLCHNGGPIWNKGTLFKTSSQHIYRILDVQRSGQIPQMILSDDAIHAYRDATLLNRATWLSKQYPDSCGGYVDWFKVEKLGSKLKYLAEKQAQQATYGLPPGELSMLATDKSKPSSKPTMKKPTVSPAYNSDDFYQIMPGCMVPKVKMVRKAA